MNLKEYLLSSEMNSELGAEYVIENGLVTLNGRVTRDASLPADAGDDVEVGDADPPLRLDAPDSYWYGHIIQEEEGLFGLGDAVLFVETRDGGFPMLAEDRGATPYLITSKDVGTGTRIARNPLTTEPRKVREAVGARVDVLVQEIELDALKALRTLEKFVSSLKPRGKALVFLSEKSHDREALMELAEEFFPGMGLDVGGTFDFLEYGSKASNGRRSKIDGGVYVMGRKRSQPSYT